MVITSDDFLLSLLADYSFSPSKSQCEAIRRYISLLLHWNQRISLTRITGIEEIVRFHFGESFFALDAVPIENGRLADVGSGTGFPGLALKIGKPALELLLLEPNHKKAAFLSEVRRELGLEAVEIRRDRFQQLPGEVGTFDFITSRAVGSHQDLARFAASRLTDRGSLVLWLGGDEASTLQELPNLAWKDPILVPNSVGRYLLVGSKQ